MSDEQRECQFCLSLPAEHEYRSLHACGNCSITLNLLEDGDYEWALDVAVANNEALAALRSELAATQRERDEVLDILWRDIHDLRDPKLTLVQVAAKLANAAYWRHNRAGAAEARLAQCQEALRRVIAEAERRRRISWELSDNGKDDYRRGESRVAGELKGFAEREEAKAPPKEPLIAQSRSDEGAE